MLVLESVAPRSSCDMRPNFSLQGRDPLVKVYPGPVCSSSAELASCGRHWASRACSTDGQSTGFRHVGGFEDEGNSAAWDRAAVDRAGAPAAPSRSILSESSSLPVPNPIRRSGWRIRVAGDRARP